MKGTPPKKASTMVRPAPGTVDPASLHEMIREKAYELFERRGCEHGHHDEDWLEAERIVCTGIEPVSELGPRPSSRPSSGKVVAHRPLARR